MEGGATAGPRGLGRFPCVGGGGVFARPEEAVKPRWEETQPKVL